MQMAYISHLGAGRDHSTGQRSDAYEQDEVAAVCRTAGKSDGSRESRWAGQCGGAERGERGGAVGRGGRDGARLAADGRSARSGLEKRARTDDDDPVEGEPLLDDVSDAGREEAALY
jgi:hypothetical protein